MKNRIIALLAVLALTASLTACGGNTAASTSIPSSSDKAEQQKSAAPSTESTIFEAVQEPSVSEPESASDVQETPEPVTYDLPLTEDTVTFSIYTTSAPGFMSPYIGTDGSYNTADSTLYFQEQTGIKLEYIEIDMFSFTQNFNLMIATGEYPDILTSMGSYNGGLTKALDDDVILDLTNYVENDMPAYAQKLDEVNAWKEVMTDDGQILAINSLNDTAVVDRGPVVRTDWMEAQGLEAPKTYEELTDFGKALQSAYNLEYAFYVSSVVNPSITLSAGFDLPGFDITTSGSHFYQKNGEVSSCLVDDNLKDYLEYLHGWYVDGLISRDFFSRSSGDVKDVFAGDGCAICWDNADYITEDNQNADLIAKGFRCGGLPIPVQEEGQTLHFSLGTDNQVGEALCISTGCEDPDLLIRAMDWCFTEPGINLCNYGIEGESYDLDTEGKPTWSPNVTDVEGVTFRAALVTYTLNSMPTCWDVTRYWSETYDEDAYEAVDLWTNVDNDKVYDMPGSLFYTTDESTIYATKITDVETYSNQYILSAITGEQDIEATWDDYVDKLYSLGLQACIDVQQAAYERYLDRQA